MSGDMILSRAGFLPLDQLTFGVNLESLIVLCLVGCDTASLPTRHNHPLLRPTRLGLGKASGEMVLT